MTLTRAPALVGPALVTERKRTCTDDATGKPVIVVLDRSSGGFRRIHDAGSDIRREFSVFRRDE